MPTTTTTTPTTTGGVYTGFGYVNILWTTVILSYILREKAKSIFLDNLLRTFKETGEFNRQYHELCFEILKSQYLELVEGKVPKELLQSTKETVRLTPELMLRMVEEIR